MPDGLHSTVDGVWGAVWSGRYSPLGLVERPEPNLAAVNLDAGASTRGSFAVVMDAQAPAWWEAWRAGLTPAGLGERRGGEECRSRGAPYHLKKKNTLPRQVC